MTAISDKGASDIPASDQTTEGVRADAVFIAGPTAGGKTAAAVKLAAALAAAGRATEIVNADAMQVYADIPILSAQPSEDERAGVPHRLFGYLSGAERGSAGRWAEAARRVIDDAAARGAFAIVVGGTGLYFRALEGGLDPAPAVPDEIRAAAEARLAKIGLSAFRAEVLSRDPAMARLDPNDRQRHVRAWAVVEATGERLSDLQRGEGEVGLRPAACVVIEPAREALYARCEARFDAMLDAGGLGEARALIARGYADDAPVMKAVGVAELIAHLKGEASLDAARDLAKRNTRRLAKRQLTWFRNQAADWPRAADAASAVRSVMADLDAARDCADAATL